MYSMSIQSTLSKLGLDEKDCRIYEAALERGESSMTDLARHAGVKRSTTYLSIDALSRLGLVSEITRGKRKIYTPVHPQRLLEIARARERSIESALPELIALYNTPKEKPKIQVFEGPEGMRLLYQEMYDSISNKEEALWFTNIRALQEYMPYAVVEYKRMLRRIRNPHIRELNYGDAVGVRWSHELRRLQGKNHVIRVLPEKHEYGSTDNLIFGNKLVIFSLKKDVFVIAIESAEIVKTYRALFEWAWKSGEGC